MRYIKSLIFVVAALCSFYFSHKCFEERAGSYVSEKTYGGDAYTGIQNAAAIAAKNAADVAEIVQKGFGYFFIVSGIILLGVAVPKDSLDKIKVPKNDKWKNIVLLLIELPIVGFLALFTLDEYSSFLAYKEHPWSVFMQRLIFASSPILIAEFLMFFFINLIFMSLSKKEIYKGVVTKSFFIKHILYLLLMVLMVLFMKLLIYDYC